MYSDADEAFSFGLDLAGMHSHPHVEPEGLDDGGAAVK
jgi:hypothetical protein